MDKVKFTRKEAELVFFALRPLWSDDEGDWNEENMGLWISFFQKLEKLGNIPEEYVISTEMVEYMNEMERRTVND